MGLSIETNQIQPPKDVQGGGYAAAIQAGAQVAGGVASLIGQKRRDKRNLRNQKELMDIVERNNNSYSKALPELIRFKQKLLQEKYYGIEGLATSNLKTFNEISERITKDPKLDPYHKKKAIEEIRRNYAQQGAAAGGATIQDIPVYENQSENINKYINDVGDDLFNHAAKNETAGQWATTLNLSTEETQKILKEKTNVTLSELSPDEVKAIIDYSVTKNPQFRDYLAQDARFKTQDDVQLYGDHLANPEVAEAVSGMPSYFAQVEMENIGLDPSNPEDRKISC